MSTLICWKLSIIIFTDEDGYDQIIVFCLNNNIVVLFSIVTFQISFNTDVFLHKKHYGYHK